MPSFRRSPVEEGHSLFKTKSFRILNRKKNMSESEIDILDIVHELLQAERSFYGTIRFFDGASRSHLVAAHMRNTGGLIAILRQYMTQPNRVTNMVLNIPLGTMDMSGNFFDSVVVAPNEQQIQAATERHVFVSANTICSICQEPVSCATRLRACGHTFHGQCIDQWFTMNPRCPVCRHDIRDNLQTPRRQENNEDRRVHSDQE
jgi:hypothetical protein